ncbi:hypothetical protein CHARACLAT_015144 [Characodon lateralis]|uniref:Uncharacterized protein n=1 Tax=Characodon lateralis TaxID=208331 RepID=A0ABU7EE18_9TELE|nr:hypothetical protein [Characodon lateralis]
MELNNGGQSGMVFFAVCKIITAQYCSQLFSLNSHRSDTKHTILGSSNVCTFILPPDHTGLQSTESLEPIDPVVLIVHTSLCMSSWILACQRNYLPVYYAENCMQIELENTF